MTKMPFSEIGIFSKPLAELTPVDFDTPPDWWKEEYGFFGHRYMECDDSVEGYRAEAQTLKERTETEVNGVIRLLDLKPGQSLIDCPCGYGRHSIGLARHGINVTGYDINSTELDCARKNAGNLPNLRLIQKDMRAVDNTNEFDAVINMFYSFGMLDTDEDNLLVLKNFYRALKPGGKFLMHTDVNMARMAVGEYKFRDTRQLQSGRRMEQVEMYDSARKRMLGLWVLVDNTGFAELTPPYSVRVYTLEEFSDMCRSVGFKAITTYGYWDMSPLSEQSEDMMFIAHK